MFSKHPKSNLVPRTSLLAQPKSQRGRSRNEVAQNRLGNGSIQWEQGKYQGKTGVKGTNKLNFVHSCPVSTALLIA